jgi:hypothetical protein
VLEQARSVTPLGHPLHSDLIARLSRTDD